MAGVVFPLGLVLWLRVWRFRLRLFRDMRVIVRTCDRLQAVLNGTFTADEGDDDAVVSLVRAQTPTSQRRKKALLWTKRVVLVLVIIAALSAGGYYGWKAWKHHQRTKGEEKIEKNEKGTPNSSNAPQNVADSGKELLPLPKEGARQLKLPEQAPE